MKILCIRDHVRSSINRAITNASFAEGRLNQRRRKKIMNNRHFYNFLRITVAVYFTYFESVIVYV